MSCLQMTDLIVREHTPGFDVFVTEATSRELALDGVKRSRRSDFQRVVNLVAFHRFMFVQYQSWLFSDTWSAET